MKAASGELNLTVITVIALALVSGLFLKFIWPAISGSIKGQTETISGYTCDDSGNCHKIESETTG